MPLELPAVAVSTVPLLALDPHPAAPVSPLKDPENPPLYGGSLDKVNTVAIALLVGLVLAGLTGVLVDRVFQNTAACRHYRLAKRPPAWSLLLLVSSYLLLLPGLFGTLFSFNILLNMMGVVKMGVGPGGGINKFPGITETMVGLIHMLDTTGSHIGAILVVIYAIVIPATKLSLIVVGECSRHVRHKLSRRCIQVLQNISKWACPDMFAYILLLHLVRGINHPPLLRAAGQLDIGFTCFSLFCIGSTVAAMGVSAPDREHGLFQKLGRALGRKGVFAVVLVLAPAFLACLVVGIGRPVMALRVELEDLYAPKGSIPVAFRKIIDGLQIPEKANADVSFLACMQALLGWIQEGEVNSAIAFAMVAFFVVACTVLDFLVLTIAAVRVLTHGTAHCVMPVAWVFKKLSMLDVALMGVIVVTMCMRIYRKDGVVVTMCDGMGWLTAAEVIHYFVYYTVKGTVESLEPKHEQDDSSDEESRGKEELSDRDEEEFSSSSVEEE